MGQASAISKPRDSAHAKAIPHLGVLPAEASLHGLCRQKHIGGIQIGELVAEDMEARPVKVNITFAACSLRRSFTGSLMYLASWG